MSLIAGILREHPEPVVIAPIGPPHQPARSLRLHPAGATNRALCLMGGSIGEGNATVSAEFKLYRILRPRRSSSTSACRSR